MAIRLKLIEREIIIRDIPSEGLEDNELLVSYSSVVERADLRSYLFKNCQTP